MSIYILQNEFGLTPSEIKASHQYFQNEGFEQIEYERKNQSTKNKYLKSERKRLERNQSVKILNLFLDGAASEEDKKGILEDFVNSRKDLFE